MISLEEALQKILATIPAPESETIPLAQAAGRFAREKVASAVDLPPFDNSAMDGYAVRAEEVAGATADHPVSLALAGTVPAGQSLPGAVDRGACARIFTGSPLPDGADAVVMQEDTRVDAGDSNRIWFHDSVKPWENLRFKGEDIKTGATLVLPGDKLTAGRLALLASAGLGEMTVARQPVVGLLATGSELAEPGQPLLPGQIYESNRVMLASLLGATGVRAVVYPIVKDTLEDTREALAKAFSECSAVITSGGVSVGEFDFVKRALTELGGRLELWRVSIKPGKPFVFGRCGKGFLFGLPGNPVSAMVTFALLVRPALLKMQGAVELNPPAFIGRLAEPLTNSGDRRHFIRVTAQSNGEVYSAGTQASHLLHSLAAANGLVDVPPKTTLPVGTKIPVLKWE